MIEEIFVVPPLGGLAMRGARRAQPPKGGTTNLAGAVPKLEFFSDRAEVTSMGGLPYGVTQADFFGGCFVPRNKEIMRVFRDLEIVEQLGSGVPRILKAYGKEAFEICDSFVRIIFRYSEALVEATPQASGTSSEKTRVETPVEIIRLLKNNPYMTLAEVAATIQKSTSAVERASSKLVAAGRLRHVGPKKGGHWEVLPENAQ